MTFVLNKLINTDATFFFIWMINVGEPKPQTVKLHAMAWLVVRQVAQK